MLAAAPLRLALAAAAGDRRLVLVVLRGGLDGLAAVAPHGDRDYRSARGALALAEPGRPEGVVDLDGFFGLHPALTPLAPWYAEGALLPIHAVATPYRERSHFDAQDLLDNGTARPRGAADGWLNRALGLFGGGDRRLGLAVGQGIPLVLRGAVPVASWQPSSLPAADPAFLHLVQALYRDDPLLGSALTEGMRAAEMADHALGETGMAARPGGGMNPRAAARMLAETAGRMLADPDGPRIAVFELPGWDTHAGQGAATGRLALALSALADSLTALRTALGGAWGQTAIAVVTEFGRTVAPNGSGGTDHGTATAAVLAGGAINGGRVLADWPGLGGQALHQGRDLAPTTDLRAVYKGLLHEHLGFPRAVLDRVVFPETGEIAPIIGLNRTRS